MSHQTTTLPLYSIAISTLLGAGCIQATESPPFQPPPFQPHEASYTVTRGNSKVGKLEVELIRRDDGLWHYRIESEATAWYVRMLGISTTEAAWFKWTENGVLPLTYHHVSREPGGDRFWQHRYDWQNMRTETRTHEGNTEIVLETDVVDPLTLRLAAIDRLTEQAPEFQSFEMPVIERDQIEQQQYRYIGMETLEIEDRCFRTAVFKRFRNKGSSRNYTAWHAKSLGWMPVKLAHEDDGKPITLTMDTWNSSASDLPAPTGCGHASKE